MRESCVTVVMCKLLLFSAFFPFIFPDAQLTFSQLYNVWFLFHVRSFSFESSHLSRITLFIASPIFLSINFYEYNSVALPHTAHFPYFTWSFTELKYILNVWVRNWLKKNSPDKSYTRKNWGKLHCECYASSVKCLKVTNFPFFVRSFLFVIWISCARLSASAYNLCAHFESNRRHTCDRNWS